MDQSELFICLRKQCRKQPLIPQSEISQHQTHDVVKFKDFRDRLSQRSQQIIDMRKKCDIRRLIEKIQTQFEDLIATLEGILESSNKISNMQMIEVLSSDNFTIERIDQYKAQLFNFSDAKYAEKVIRDFKQYYDQIEYHVDNFLEGFRGQNDKMFTEINNLAAQKPIKIMTEEDPQQCLPHIKKFADQYSQIKLGPQLSKREIEEMEAILNVAKVELTQVVGQPLEKYNYPLMNLALLKLFWFDIYATSASGSNFTKSYAVRLIPNRLPYSMNIDDDHSLMDLSMEIGAQVYGQDTEECADFYLNVGKSCQKVFNSNLFEKESLLFNEALRIYKAKNSLLKMLVAMVCVGNSYFKLQLLDPAVNDYYEPALQKIPEYFQNPVAQENARTRILGEILKLKRTQTHPKIEEYRSLLQRSIRRA